MILEFVLRSSAGSRFAVSILRGRALARAAAVTVEYVKEQGGSLYFTCWTDPENCYNIVYDPTMPGGWCKHVARCASFYLPWLPQAAAGAAKLKATVKEQGREIKAWEKQAKKLEMPRP